MNTSLRAKELSLTSIFPDIPKVKRLIVVTPSESVENTDYWIWVKALQGLINKVEPHIYVLSSRYNDAQNHWLNIYSKDYGIPIEEKITPEQMLVRYAHLVKGYTLYDEIEVLQTQNIAITLCGLESALPIAPSQEKMMQIARIKKTNDLRGRFENDWSAAEWAIENLWPRCNKRMYANFCIHRPFWYAMGHDLVDYIVYNKVLALDLPRSRTHRRTLSLFRELMKTAEAPGVQLNWHCIWDQEKEYVAEAAKCGFFSLCSSGTQNMTIHGGVGDKSKAYSQPLPSADECKAEKDKIYVCLYNSDGDATWAMHNLHHMDWLDPDRGEFKFGWGLLPLMVSMMPGILEYYHKTKLDNDCFWGPSSGAGYTYSWLWPDDLAEHYLKETRRLLNQSGQNGCNMVNWFLQDWWREVEDDFAVGREQKHLAPGPGLICGLGGSPYAKSYPNGNIPKLHSVHIATIGQDNIGDIVKLSKECPTRPLFLFLFAQIQPGIFKQLNSEMVKLRGHGEIELLSMDQFFLTLQDAVKKDLIKEELYEKTDELAETWLRKPGRHRLPLYESLSEEMADIALDTPKNRAKRIADSGCSQLVSGEIENIAPTRERFVNYHLGRTPPSEEEEADALFYAVFTVAWGVIRSTLEANGIYANNRQKCLEDFCNTCSDVVNPEMFKEMFSAWDNWESDTPSISKIVDWCLFTKDAAKTLNKSFGESGEIAWPPKTI